MDLTCALLECQATPVRRGYCHRHYRQALRTGVIESRIKPLAERLRDGSLDQGGCRVWRTTKSNGYGSISIRNRNHLVHRVAWESARGPIPSGMVIDHLCHNRACIRIEHLAVVTPAHNTQNMAGAQKRSITGVRGVSPVGERFKAAVAHNGRTHCMGFYATVEEAAEAALAGRLRIFEHSDLPQRTEDGRRELTGGPREEETCPGSKSMTDSTDTRRLST